MSCAHHIPEKSNSLSPLMLLHKLTLVGAKAEVEYRELVSGFSEIACVLATKAKLNRGSDHQIGYGSHRQNTKT